MINCPGLYPASTAVRFAIRNTLALPTEKEQSGTNIGILGGAADQSRRAVVQERSECFACFPGTQPCKYRAKNGWSPSVVVIHKCTKAFVNSVRLYAIEALRTVRRLQVGELELARGNFRGAADCSPDARR